MTGRLAVAVPVVGLALVAGLGVVGSFGVPPGPEPVTAEIAATIEPSAATPNPALTARPARVATTGPAAGDPVSAPAWSGETRPPTGEDGLMGGIPFGTAWRWLTDGANRP